MGANCRTWVKSGKEIGNPGGEYALLPWVNWLQDSPTHPPAFRFPAAEGNRVDRATERRRHRDWRFHRRERRPDAVDDRRAISVRRLAKVGASLQAGMTATFLDINR